MVKAYQAGLHLSADRWSTPHFRSTIPDNMPRSERSVRARLLAARRRSPLLGRPGFLIRRLHQLHSALFLEETRGFDITPVQYSLMTALAARGELEQNSLALEIGLERTSVAEVVPRLQRRGLLARRRSTDDGRVKLVRLTRKGGALLRRMAPKVRRAHDRTIDQLAGPERDLFLLQLIELVEANNHVGSVRFRLFIRRRSASAARPTPP
jgi:DNA-binding MarR family transcriptional regulator